VIRTCGRLSNEYFKPRSNFPDIFSVEIANPYTVRGMVLNPRCSVFQFVMYIKSFLSPSSHVRVTIIPFLVFYLTTLSFASLHMASVPDEGHASMGHWWYDTGGKNQAHRHSFVVHSASERVTG
jgi:hypothetical protein